MAGKSERVRLGWLQRCRWALLYGGIAFVLASQATGFVSSNDGSHVALARALALRGTTLIDPDVALTLNVDYAQRNGHTYSDRPPGTAFLAVPAVVIGNALDAPLLRLSRSLGELAFVPASVAFANTYAARTLDPPPLRERLGTAWMITLHAVLVGLVGLTFFASTVRRLGYSPATAMTVAGAFAVSSLWGPYSTTLFGHGSAAMWVALAMWCGHRASSSSSSSVTYAGLVGLCAGWAMATQYTLLLPMSIAIAVTLPQRRWIAVLVGAAMPLLMTAAYHDAAFGSPWSVGYEHHARFGFARVASSTFSGHVLTGLWTLAGAGRGAGLLVQAPIVLLGVWGVWRAPAFVRRWAIAFVPWVVLLAAHRTPFGGGTMDHRYLVPVLPLLGLGVAHVVAPIIARRRIGVWVVMLATLALVSSFLVWSHFLAWHHAEPFGSLRLGVSIGIVVAILAALLAPWCELMLVGGSYGDKPESGARSGGGSLPPSRRPSHQNPQL